MKDLLTTPLLQQKANLARIRDNQRRSRARKREYLQELEQRLRLCELQGIEASSEVQAAARRVAEENRHLRELLHKQGISDDYITHYIQGSLNSPRQPAELSPTAAFAGNPGTHVQALQQVLMPRRPVCLDSNTSVTIANNQASRETSITSASTSNSSLWETPQPTQQQQPPQQQQPQHQHQHQQPQGMAYHQSMAMAQTMAGPSGGGIPYTAQVYGRDTTPRVDAFHGHTPDGMLEDHHQSAYNPHQPLQPSVHEVSISFDDTNTAFNPDPRDYNPHGGYC